jgi:hypothetical protein
MILFNDASLHEQFNSVAALQSALETVLGIKTRLQQDGHSLYVSRLIRSQKVSAKYTLNDCIGKLPRETKTRLLKWLDNLGPFWEDEQTHDSGEWFEHVGKVVTNTGLAEAAFRNKQNNENICVASITPSNYAYTPLCVEWKEGHLGIIPPISIENCFNIATLAPILKSQEKEVTSWEELLDWRQRTCRNLTLSSDKEILKQLGYQFIHNVANRAKVLLKILDDMAIAHATDNSKFLNLKSTHMRGDRARFSDSSDTELQQFKSKLTFTHPVRGASVLCSWHGKIQTPPYRIHFEWPPENGKIFVAYIGPKLTMK